MSYSTEVIIECIGGSCMRIGIISGVVVIAVAVILILVVVNINKQAVKNEKI